MMKNKSNPWSSFRKIRTSLRIKALLANASYICLCLYEVIVKRVQQEQQDQHHFNVNRVALKDMPYWIKWSIGVTNMV